MHLVQFILSLFLCEFGIRAAKIEDNDRACPEGFFYAGEATSPETNVTRELEKEFVDKSPVYSCYKFIQEKVDFSQANAICSESNAQLLSVDGILEQEIINSAKFTEKFPLEIVDMVEEEGNTPEMLTSGIELAPNRWTWLGADAPVDDSINIVSNTTTANVQCITVSWLKRDNQTELVFAPVECVQSLSNAVCEVHVYTVTWRVWFVRNWLQIMFLLTVSILIFFSCCIFINMICHQSQKCEVEERSAQNGSPRSPPPYTPTDNYYTNNSFVVQTHKYKEKGKELLSKVKLPARNINWQRMSDA